MSIEFTQVEQFTAIINTILQEFYLTLQHVTEFRGRAATRICISIISNGPIHFHTCQDIWASYN